MTVQQPALFAYHREVIPMRSTRKQAVLEALAKWESMTNSELAAALGWGINRVTPRVNELREAGQVGCCNPACPNRARLNARTDIVHDACKRRCRVTGASVFAWRGIVGGRAINRQNAVLFRPFSKFIGRSAPSTWVISRVHRVE